MMEFEKQSEIITARYNAGLGTVVTTNLFPGEIPGQVDERVASRLNTGLVVRFPSTISDFRQRLV